ncbi:MAG: SRPBCC domain-containing protein [Thiohalomonadales bacterium]
MNKPIAAELLVRRKFNVGRELVFAAFTDAKALQHWIAPQRDIKTKVIEFNFHIGGRYRFEFLLPDGTLTFLIGEYQIIDPPNKLSFTWCWEKPDPHAGIDSLVTVEFIDNNNMTELVISHVKFETTEMKQRHAEGWSGTLTRLQAWLDKTIPI